MKKKSCYNLFKQHIYQREKIERDLNLRLKQQEAIAQFGEYAINSRDLQDLYNQAVKLTAETLDVEMCKVLELLPDGSGLILRSGVGWREGLVGHAVVSAGVESQAGFTLLADAPVIVRELQTESRFSGPQLLVDHGVTSGISVVIPGKEKPFGVLGVHTSHLRIFSSHDAQFLKSIANILASAIERLRTEVELHKSLEEMEIIFNGVSEGITAQDPTGKLVYANHTAARMLGYSSVKELLRASLPDLLHQFDLYDENGDPFSPEHLPGRLVLQGAEKASAKIRFHIKQTGEEHWAITDATPVRDANGNVILVVNIFRNITEMVARENSQKLMAEAGRLLSSTLDHELILENIAKLAVTDLADWCTIYIVTESEDVYQLTMAHKDPTKVEMAAEFLRRYPTDWNAKTGVPNVIRTGQAEYYPEITEAMLEAVAQSPEHLQDIRKMELRSMMIIPLVTRNRILGAISLIWAESGRTYSASDIKLVQELASRAAIAIDNARLYERAQALNAELEDRVGQRTEQLKASIKQMMIEVEERRKAEDALRESETMLNSFFESAPDAKVLVDHNGTIVRVNRQTEAMFGYQRDELLGKPVEILLPGRFRARHTQHRSRYSGNMVTRPMGAGLNLFGVRKDGSEFPVDIMLSPVQTSQGDLVISAIRDITEQKRLQTELAETHRRLFESIEAQRLLLSQELHDGPIQDLYGVTYHLEGIKPALRTAAELEELSSAKEGLQNVISTLRQICGDLRPPTLTHFGLEKAIRSHLARIEEKHPELVIIQNLHSDGQLLPERVRLALYRVYQNAISNIIRHAQAKHIRVDFQVMDGQVTLKIQDDGQGFSMPHRWVELARSGHFGLVGMAERVEAVNGHLQVTSAPGEGTTVQVTVPLRVSVQMPTSV